MCRVSHFPSLKPKNYLYKGGYAVNPTQPYNPTLKIENQTMNEHMNDKLLPKSPKARAIVIALDTLREAGILAECNTYTGRHGGTCLCITLVPDGQRETMLMDMSAIHSDVTDALDHFRVKATIQTQINAIRWGGVDDGL